MKHTLIIAALLAAASSTAFAAKAGVGNCIYPKHDNTVVYEQPNTAPTTRMNKVGLFAFTVKAVAPGGWVRLETVPNYSLPNPDAGAGQFAGWAKMTDFIQQDLRNCN
ncbi:hypothetical protein [Aquitalea aquatilis]|uniref:hypothetical protein n=1 Tax=Aquitalea aquatilis TaxID=1537400 RepID=UPI0010BD93D1|nr:hypothetical protein [Aquitalea aquatilis]